MGIIQSKASYYSTVSPEYVVECIRNYVNRIALVVESDDLQNKDKIQLNIIASELGTVCNRLDYILGEKY